MTANFTPLEIVDFSGGITDNPVNAAINKYAIGDNFLITLNRKPYLVPGSALWDATLDQIPAGAQRLGMITEHDGDLLFQSAKKVYYEAAGAWVTLQGTTSNEVLATSLVTNVTSWAHWNNHLFMTNDAYSPVSKIYDNNAGTKTVRTAGMPALASAPTVASAGGAGASSYIYSFLYYYTYQVGTVTFEDYGAVTSVALNSVDAPNVSTVNITAIPIIANSATYNYDTTVIKVYIYRTQHGGTSYTYIGNVTNGTATYNDTATDASIVNNAGLYTAGGVLENTSPPLCKYIHVVNNIGYYAHIKEGTEILGNKWQQSIKNDIDSCPSSLSGEVGANIKGISSYEGRPLLFTEFAHYRIEGEWDELGRGTVNTEKVKDGVGCISSNSIVQTPAGVFFAGKYGFYFTDGYKSFRVSNEFNATYAGLVETTAQQNRLYGAYDAANHRVWWTVQTSSAGAAEVDKSFVLDIRWGLKPDMCFTTVSNGTNWAPSAIYFQDGNLIRGDRRGYIFEHDDEVYTHPLIDTSIVTGLWGTKAIIFDYTSAAFGFGNPMVRKLTPRINLISENITNMATQIKSIVDIGRRTTDITPNIFRGNADWGDPMWVWGDANFQWGIGGIIEGQRRFPGNDQRCSFRQIQITNAYIIIANSDAYCTATVDATAKTATLTDTVTYDWPSDVLEYYISFGDDDYDTEFAISARTADVITFTDAGGLSTDGTVGWYIKGYKKEQCINIYSYAMEFMYLGDTQRRYTSESLGANV